MKIVTAGDNCIDYYINENKVYPGGNPVNVAVYSKRYVNDVTYIGYVGEDEYAHIIINSLREKGIDVSRVRQVSGNTAVTKVRSENGERVFLSYDGGVNASFKLEEDDISFCLGCDAFVTGFWGMCDSYLARLHRGGILTVFDFATKLDNPLVESIAKHVDYAFFSWTEDLDKAKIKAYLESVVKMGAGCAVMTLGNKGSLAFDGIDYYYENIIDCPVVDTMGAGDSYIAGFICGILSGKRIQASMLQGTQSSTITIQYRGAW